MAITTVEDQTMDLLEKIWTGLTETIDNAIKRHDEKKELKAYKNTLNAITNGGKCFPNTIYLDKSGLAFKKQLEDAIEVYNIGKKEKDKIHYIPFKTAEGYVFLTDARGAELIKQLEKNLLAKENILASEITPKEFEDKYKDYEGIDIENLSDNEINMIKQKPWAHKSFKDAMEHYTFSYAEIPHKNKTHEALFLKKDELVQNGVYETLLCAKANLSGEVGEKIEHKMNYERDVLHMIRNYDKVDIPESGLFITGATNSNTYMKISKEGIVLYQTALNNGNYVEVKADVFDKEKMSIADFEKKVTDAFKSMDNPCLLETQKECQKHCIKGGTIQECLNVKGEKTPTIILNSEDIKSVNHKISLMAAIATIAKNDIEHNKILPKDVNIKMFSDTCVKAYKTIISYSKRPEQLENIRNPKTKQMLKEAFSHLYQVSEKDVLAVLNDLEQTKIKQIDITPKKMQELMQNESVDKEALEKKIDRVSIEMEEFGINSLGDIAGHDNILVDTEVIDFSDWEIDNDDKEDNVKKIESQSSIYDENKIIRGTGEETVKTRCQNFISMVEAVENGKSNEFFDITAANPAYPEDIKKLLSEHKIIEAIELMNTKSEKELLDIVKAEPTAIQYIYKPTLEMQETAVKLNAGMIKYTDETPELWNTAIETNAISAIASAPNDLPKDLQVKALKEADKLHENGASMLMVDFENKISDEAVNQYGKETGKFEIGEIDSVELDIDNQDMDEFDELTREQNKNL